MLAPEGPDGSARRARGRQVPERASRFETPDARAHFFGGIRFATTVASSFGRADGARRIVRARDASGGGGFFAGMISDSSGGKRSRGSTGGVEGTCFDGAARRKPKS